MNIPDIVVGDNVKYTNFKFFKKGGMGEIYKGNVWPTGEEIALKLMLIENPDEEALLQREVHISERLAHPNIVTALRTGRLSIDGNKYLYIAQDFYTKGNMRSLIRSDLPVQARVVLMQEILNGMQELHKQIVHRDLKPENILISGQGQLAITDFGLAKYIDERTRTRTYKGGGTYPYMAPECWTLEENTISMDIYSLGVIFFEILTGQLPFVARSDQEWKEFHLFAQLPNIDTLRPGLTTKFNQIIQKMTSKRAAERYASVEQVIAAVKDAAKVNASNDSEGARIASLGNAVIQARRDQQLKESQERERTNNLIKLLNYQIQEVFNQFIERVRGINEHLEIERISTHQQQANPLSTARSLKLTFNGRSITIEFVAHTALAEYEKALIRREQELQPQHGFYGKRFQEAKPSFVTTQGITMVGLAETDFQVGNNNFGFNLVLKKTSDPNYGDWYVVQFSKNISPPETRFGLDLDRFFDKYEELDMSMYHTTNTHKLADHDITSLLEALFQ